MNILYQIGILLLLIETGTGEEYILSECWSGRNKNGSIKLSYVTIPGSIHEHLRAHSVIQNPYYRFNELDSKWIAHETWIYECGFDWNMSIQQALLVVNSVDTVARYLLNGKLIGTSENMFRQHTFNLSLSLRYGFNHLKIVLSPALEYAASKAQSYPYKIPSTINPHTWAEPSNRAFIRKTGASFGWDWGPAIVSTGIYSSVYISYQVNDKPVLNGIEIIPRVFLENKTAQITAAIQLEQRQKIPRKIRALMRVSKKNNSHQDEALPVLQRVVELTANKMEFKLRHDLLEPRLWWPAGYGEPFLYDIQVELQTTEETNATFAKHQVSIGLREIELVRVPLDEAASEYAETFYFRVNGVNIFMKGANWIPADSLPTQITSTQLQYLLKSVVAANMNMIRVWGGGNYEPDEFYDICDNLGILVWQEMMFACSMYPRDEGFLEEIKAEILYQIQRLRHHASIIIWGGNNENESVMEQFEQGLFVNSSIPFNRDLYVVDYSKLFVDTVRMAIHSADRQHRPFVDTSPSNGIISSNPYIKRWGNTSNKNAGDIHFYDYVNDCHNPAMFPKARFVSEFGFQSMPSFTSIKPISIPEDWSFDSPLMRFRLRHENGTQQMQAQIKRHFQWPVQIEKQEQKFASEIYLSQLQQAQCYSTAIGVWRRLTGAFNTSTAFPRHLLMGGILYWQLNDIWQGPSWSSMEYNGHWKLLHYFVKRLFAPVTISMYQHADVLHVFLLSDSMNPINGTITFELRRIISGTIASSFNLTGINVPSQMNLQLEKLSIPALLSAASGKTCTKRSCYLRVHCHHLTPTCPEINWFFTEVKHLDFAHPKVTIHSIEKSITNPPVYKIGLVAKLAVALFVEIENTIENGYFSDNGLILIPDIISYISFIPSSPITLNITAFNATLTLRWYQELYGIYGISPKERFFSGLKDPVYMWIILYLLILSLIFLLSTHRSHRSLNYIELRTL